MKNTIKALLHTYKNEKAIESELVELPSNYDGDPYGETVPFSVGSNQSIEVLSEDQFFAYKSIFDKENENEIFEPNRGNCADNNDYHGLIGWGR